MNNKLSFILIALFITLTFTTVSHAQDYTQWHLPEGAKARFGKGWILGDIAYSPDGSKIAIAGSIGVWIYDAQTGEELDLLTGHNEYVYSVSFSPDGNTIASRGSSKTIRLLDVNTGWHIRTLSGGRTGFVRNESDVVFSPDGSTIASGSSDTVRLWNAYTGEHIRSLSGHTGSVRSVVFSPDGKTIASGSFDNTIRLWDADTGTEIRTLSGHTGSVRSLVFSPDGKTIASGSRDNIRCGMRTLE